MEPTFEQVVSWNREVGTGTRRAFEHRVLLGIGINMRRPEHGKVTDYHLRVADELERSDRWVRETVHVARAVNKAIEDGLQVPLEIRDIAWRKVPWAITNLRLGRPLLWEEPEEEEEESEVMSEEEFAAQVGEALAALVEALEVVESSRLRARLTQDAIARLEEVLGRTMEEEGSDSGREEPAAQQDGGQRGGGGGDREGRRSQGAAQPAKRDVVTPGFEGPGVDAGEREAAKDVRPPGERGGEERSGRQRRPGRGQGRRGSEGHGVERGRGQRRRGRG